MTREKILATVKKNDIDFMRLMFTDIAGFPKCIQIPADELEGALVNGKGFDGSSIEGFTRIYESDMIAMPDPETFKLVTWHDGDVEGLMFCDVLLPNGQPYEGDPRFVLRKVLSRLESKKWRFMVGTELEYFYFTSAEYPEVLDHAGYFDLQPPDLGEELRKKTIKALHAIGIPIEYSHHEVAPSQHELDLKYTDALRMADDTIMAKLLIKEVARKEGVHATFMPKPIYGENGSGMHTHQSIFKGKKNVFFDKDGVYHLSDTARAYLEGLLRHAREIALITDQWVNSYKRLVPGFEAPVYVSWAQQNRSTLVRVPQYRRGHDLSTRIELRCPDAACNPYLAFAVQLAAGLKGIEEGYECREPIEENIFGMGAEEREGHGISMLPGSLGEAVGAARKSDLLPETLGQEMFDKLLRNKTALWDDYRGYITQYEMERDLPVL